MYQDSCLIYASADPAVLKEIPGCATVAHTIKGGGAMLALERMARIAEQNKKFSPNFNYASNLFSDARSFRRRTRHGTARVLGATQPVKMDVRHSLRLVVALYR